MPGNESNPGAKSYWQGYRDGRIFALMFATERTLAIKANTAYYDQDERYQRGFDRALDQLEKELADLVKLDRDY